jgi:hypothetical protein
MVDFDSDGPMWNYLWTETTDNDDGVYLFSILTIIFRSSNRTLYHAKVFASPKFDASAKSGFRVIHARCNLACPVEESLAPRDCNHWKRAANLRCCYS